MKEQEENLWITLARNLIGVVAVGVVVYIQDQSFRYHVDEAWGWLRKRNRAWVAAFRAARPAWLQVIEDTPAVIAEAERARDEV